MEWIIILWSLLSFSGESLWIEGEAATQSSFNNHSWYCCNGVRPNLLSPGSPVSPGTPGEWLSHYSNGGGEASATYEIDLSMDSSYDIWVRASCYLVQMTLSVDGGEEIPVDTDNGCREVWNMNWPGIDIRFMGWIKIPGISLDAGNHTLQWKLSHHPNMSGEQVHGGTDAIHITNAPWGPAGSTQPEPMPAEATDWYIWAPGDPPKIQAILSSMHLAWLKHPPGNMAYYNEVAQTSHLLTIRQSNFGGLEVIIQEVPNWLNNRRECIACLASIWFASIQSKECLAYSTKAEN